MDKPLASETQSQIRALCEAIAQRDQLGEDVQEELRGHIEDKIIGYLDGHEAVTEQDAVILAREHFGKPQAVKQLLQSVHLDILTLTLARRLSVAVIAMLLATLASRVFTFLSSLPAFALMGPRASFYWLWLCPLLSGTFSACVILVLLRKAHKHKDAIAARLEGTTLRHLAMYFGLALLLHQLIPSVTPMGSSDFHLPEAVAFIGQAWGFVLAIIPGVLWLWWSDQPPRSSGNLRQAVAAWVAYLSCINLLTIVLPSWSISIASGAPISFQTQFTQPQISLGTSATESFAFIAIFVTVHALLSYALYSIVTRWTRPRRTAQ